MKENLNNAGKKEQRQFNQILDKGRQGGPGRGKTGRGTHCSETTSDSRAEEQVALAGVKLFKLTGPVGTLLHEILIHERCEGMGIAPEQSSRATSGNVFVTKG